MSTLDTYNIITGNGNASPEAELDVIVPNDPKIHKIIRDGLEEISASKTRAAAERTLQTETFKRMAQDTKVPKKFLRKLAKFGSKEGAEQAESEMESLVVAAGQVFTVNKATEQQVQAAVQAANP